MNKQNKNRLIETDQTDGCPKGGGRGERVEKVKGVELILTTVVTADGDRR